MQQDENLKELLETGAMESTSPAFTGNVMKRIERIKYINEPLISSRWVRVYRVSFLSVVALLVLTSLLIKISSVSFSINVQLPDTYFQYTDTIILYIVAFWALIFLSQKLGNNARNTSDIL